MTELSPTARPGVMRQYWSAHQRFFKQLCISIKLPTVVRRAPPPKTTTTKQTHINLHLPGALPGACRGVLCGLVS